jgi:hypothetical protein
MQAACKAELSSEPEPPAVAAAPAVKLSREADLDTSASQNNGAADDAALTQCRSPQPDAAPAMAAAQQQYQQQHQQQLLLQQQQLAVHRAPATFRECMQPVLSWMEEVAITSR